MGRITVPERSIGDGLPGQAEIKITVYGGGYLRAGCRPAATVCDGSRSAAMPDGAATVNVPAPGLSVAVTLIGRACQQLRFAESDVRHSL